MLPHHTSTIAAVLLCILLALSLQQCHASSSSGKKTHGLSGYLIYCPCMGRFGNQAEQFLGSLAFAKSLGRTLVVPPWITYGGPPMNGGAGIILVPFIRHFNLTTLTLGHPTLSLEQFMDKLAPAIWPKGSRTVFCHSPQADGTCQAKFGSPFGPFWDTFGISFDREEFYARTVGHLLAEDSEAWRQLYPSNKFPVLAFMGAPGSYPARPSDLSLHRHLVYNSEFLMSLDLIMAKWNMQRPILAVHLRNNVDFTGACASILKDLPPGHGLFSSYQCFGPRSSRGHLTLNTCSPDDATIAADVRRIASAMAARTIFVATDFDGRLELMAEAAASASSAGRAVNIVSSLQTGTTVFEDTGLMSLADATLLNCASSLSAFVRRNRDTAGLRTDYLGLAGATGWRHDEL